MEKGKIRKSKSRKEKEKKGGGMGERMKKIQEENLKRGEKVCP